MIYYVGIDVAKFKHDFTVVTSNGEVVIEPTTFKNNDEGFSIIKDSLSKLDHSQEIKIGLESTGHYHKNLVNFLITLGYEVNVLNPFLVHKFIESRTLRKQKTDSQDCGWIARYLESEDYKAYQSKVYTNESLKSLSRNRDKLIRSRSDQIVVVTNCLDKIFPEFRTFFNNIMSKTALCILYEFNSAAAISKITNAKMQSLKKKYKGLRLSKLFDLKDLAKITVGTANEQDSFVMKQAIRQIFTYNEILEDYEKEIDKIMDSVNSPLESIPGVGRKSAAAIIGEYNNFNGFADADKLLAFAGLECSRYQSGQSDYRGKMVKRVSPHLRYVLMNLAISLKNNNAVFREYYLKKREEGKKYRVALNHVVRKFLRISFKLVSTNQTFNID